MRQVSLPEHVDFSSQGRRDYWVALEHDHNWADHLIPLTVLVGPEVEPGRGLVACGANHGNEYEGPIALKHFLHEVMIEEIIGRVIIVPVLNVSAFASGARASVADDGVNMNRAFVPGAGEDYSLNGITHRIARFWREYIWPQVHVAIDIHSGGTVAAFASCVSFHDGVNDELAARIEAAARLFGTPFIATYRNMTPGLLTSEGERLGKIMLGTELGFGESVNPTGVRRAKHGVRSVAILEGLVRGSAQAIDHHADGTQRRVSFADRRSTSIATVSGIFEPCVEIGDEVRAGQRLGYLHDFQRIDSVPLTVEAQLDGVLFACAFRAPVSMGQHIAVVATPW